MGGFEWSAKRERRNGKHRPVRDGDRGWEGGDLPYFIYFFGPCTRVRKIAVTGEVWLPAVSRAPRVRYTRTLCRTPRRRTQR